MPRTAHIISFATAFLLMSLPPGPFGQGSPAGAATLVLETGTPIVLQLTQTVSSAYAHKGDRLRFVVKRDVLVGGFTVVRAGAIAEGSIIGVKRRRPLGIGGDMQINVDSVELVTGERVDLVAHKEFKGRSHTIRMAVTVAIAGAIYPPVAPVLLLSPGRNSMVLKGTEVTAYTKTDYSVEAGRSSVARESVSELSELVKLLPPRVVNGEGREGDMLNVIFVAREEELREAFAKAGWLEMDNKSQPQKIVWHLLWQRNHYMKLPMDRLYVFGRAQDYSYALPDPESIVGRRHHLRIWKTDREVDGIPLWVGAATHDIGIEFVKHKLWFFHRIDPNVDAERDYVAVNLAENWQFTRKEYVRCAEPVLDGHTATGQPFYSDNKMLLVGLSRGVAPKVAATEVAVKLP
jgi:hypothetical protein